MTQVIQNFFKMESSGGILLILAAALAMWTANSTFYDLYEGTLASYVGGLSLRHWINDGLMAIFFLLIGLEVKRELIEGALKEKETAMFPAIAAVGGMLIPALFYVLFNAHDPATIKGWAIPAATDIAFALGIMALLGKRVPSSLKIFLLALAIIDDLGVIVIIALFYTNQLSIWAMGIAMTMIFILWFMNYRKVTRILPYMIVGAILWAAVLKSGVHATLAGVVLGFLIPIRGKTEAAPSPLKTVEHTLHPYVSFLILPIFAFANAGIALQGISFSDLGQAVPLGVTLGLCLGKPIGVFVFSWVAVKMKWAELPEQVNFRQVFAVAVLCGIGFTMSIFISSLAFADDYPTIDAYARLGILLGSSISAIVGYFLLQFSLPRKPLVHADESISDH